MADQNPMGAERHPANRDAQIESAVLALLLDEHPAALTDAELALALVGERPEFTEADAIARAVRDLIGAGLLRRHGELIQPTRAAVRFERLQAHR